MKCWQLDGLNRISISKWNVKTFFVCKILQKKEKELRKTIVREVSSKRTKAKLNSIKIKALLNGPFCVIIRNALKLKNSNCSKENIFDSVLRKRKKNIAVKKLIEIKVKPNWVRRNGHLFRRMLLLFDLLSLARSLFLSFSLSFFISLSCSLLECRLNDEKETRHGVHVLTQSATNFE